MRRAERVSQKAKKSKAMEQDSQRDLFFPIVNSGALMWPFLLTASLFPTGIFVFYSVNEIIRTYRPNGLV